MALWRWQHPGNPDEIVTHRCFAPVGFDLLPGWQDDDHAEALRAFLNFRGQDPCLNRLLDIAAAWTGPARSFFETWFRPYRIGHEPGGLLTGYFEPELAASLHTAPGYPFPVYRLPDDLELMAEPQAGLPAGAQLTAHRRIGDRLEPYFTRAEIEAGALAGRGLEIAWVRDAVELYIMHVQGSGVLVCKEGRIRVTFAGKNGHAYTSIGKRLIETGHLDAAAASLDKVVAWLRANPAEGKALMHENKSYIFFEFLTGEDAVRGPRGSFGASLVPGRSMAVDPRIHRPGLPIWVDAPGLDAGGFRFPRLMLAHDTGSAIRGAERGDVFFGTGADAGQAAGSLKHPCRFFALLPAYDDRNGG